MSVLIAIFEFLQFIAMVLGWACLIAGVGLIILISLGMAEISADDPYDEEPKKLGDKEAP